MKNNFCKKTIKVKSSWFDKNGKMSKIGVEAFYLYVTLYRDFRNDGEESFGTCLKNLKQWTGYTYEQTLNLLKKLIRHKIIECSITRWDRCKIDTYFSIKSIDIPQTYRGEKNGVKVDIPQTENDYYTIVDLEIIQMYIDQKLDILCISIFPLLNRYIGIEGKSFLSINEMSKRLSVGNGRILKAIYSLNRNYFLCSIYRSNQKRGDKNLYMEHHLFNSFTKLEEHRNFYQKQIENNIKDWS